MNTIDCKITKYFMETETIMEIANHEYYVSLEVAKLLKEAGFDWKVNHSYPNCESLDNSCSGYMEDLSFYHNLNDGKYGGMSAPTLNVAQRWLRVVKGIHLYVRPILDEHKYVVTVVVDDLTWRQVNDNNGTSKNLILMKKLKKLV